MGKFENGEQDAQVSGMEAYRETQVIDRSKENLSYREQGKQRREAFQASVASGWKSLKEKFSGSVGWLAKKAETGLDLAFAAPAAAGDVADATIGGVVQGAEWASKKAREDYNQTVADAKAAGEYIKADYNKTKADARAVAEAGVAKAKKGKDAVVAGTMIGAGVALGVGVMGIEATKASGRYVGEKATAAKNEIVAGAKARLEQTKESALNKIDYARVRTNMAVDSFNNWRNEQRLKKAADLLGLKKEQLQKLIAHAQTL